MSMQRRRLYIGGLFHGATCDDVKERFGKFGDISNVSVKTKQDGNGKNLQFCTLLPDSINALSTVYVYSVVYCTIINSSFKFLVDILKDFLTLTTVGMDSYGVSFKTYTVYFYIL